MGACLLCPKCSNYFTGGAFLVSAGKAPKPSLNPSSPRAAAEGTVSPPPAEQPWWVTTPPHAAVASEPEPPSPQPLANVSFPFPHLDLPRPPSPPSESTLPEWINAWGVSAFSLASLVLLFAAFALPRWLAMSFAGLGLLLGTIGVTRPRLEWKPKDGIWLALGGGGCGLLLLVGLLWPSWLSERWAMSFVVREPDIAKPVRVSRSNVSEVRELDSDERVDAARYAIRHGDLLIRIEPAEIKHLKANDAPLLLICCTSRMWGSFTSSLIADRAAANILPWCATVAASSYNGVIWEQRPNITARCRPLRFCPCTPQQI